MAPSSELHYSFVTGFRYAVRFQCTYNDSVVATMAADIVMLRCYLGMVRRKLINSWWRQLWDITVWHRMLVQTRNLQASTTSPRWVAVKQELIQINQTIYKLTGMWHSYSWGTNDMMIPLSTEKLSVGRPAMFQRRICTGSPSVPISEKSPEHGMPFLRVVSVQFWIWSWKSQILSSSKYERVDIQRHAVHKIQN